MAGVNRSLLAFTVNAETEELLHKMNYKITSLGLFSWWNNNNNEVFREKKLLSMLVSGICELTIHVRT